MLNLWYIIDRQSDDETSSIMVRHREESDGARFPGHYVKTSSERPQSGPVIPL